MHPGICSPLSRAEPLLWSIRAASENSVTHEPPRRRVSVSIEVEKNDVSISDAAANEAEGRAGSACRDPMEEAGRGACPGPSVSQSVSQCGRGRGTERLRAEQSPPLQPGPRRTDRLLRTPRGAAASRAVAGALSVGRGRLRGPRAERRLRPVPFAPPRLRSGE